MKHSAETHAARFTAWQAGRVRGRKGRTKQYIARKALALRLAANARYRAFIVQGKLDGRGSRAATKAPHSKDLRRRRHAIAKASRRAQR